MVKETPGETPFLYFSRFSFSPACFVPSFPAGSAQSLPVPGGDDTGLGFAFPLVSSSSLCVYSLVAQPQVCTCSAMVPPWAGPFREKWPSGNFMKFVEENAMSCTWAGMFPFANAHVRDQRSTWLSCGAMSHPWVSSAPPWSEIMLGVGARALAHR